MATNIKVTVSRAGISQQVQIEDLTDDELKSLLKRATPSQVRAYCYLLVSWIRDHYRQNAAPLAEESPKRTKKKTP